MSMPALFVGHGNPMNAIEDNEFSRTWTELGKSMPRPNGVVCISAHWETDGTCVTAMEHPATIHDFTGFPAALENMVYPAPGSPELAERVRATARSTRIRPDRSWGLDHGAWSVLCRMYPPADIPVVQVSLDMSAPPAFHYELGKEMGELRKEGILILGSGNMAHNLRNMAWQQGGFDWAMQSDAAMADLIVAANHQALIDYPNLPNARQAIPTEEHYLPLLYVLGAAGADNSPTFFNDRVTLGSISMRCVRFGQ